MQTIPATRFDLDRWMKTLPQPWTAAMETTVFTAWDLRSPAATCRGAEGSASADASGHRGGEKEKTIVLMRARFATVCAAIFCRSATWPQRRFASGGDVVLGKELTFLYPAPRALRLVQFS